VPPEEGVRPCGEAEIDPDGVAHDGSLHFRESISRESPAVTRGILIIKITTFVCRIRPFHAREIFPVHRAKNRF
jgi:hypothetical protein